MANTTTCTHCDTVFIITDEQLRLSKGIVRCGHCNQRFKVKHIKKGAPKFLAPDETTTLDDTQENDFETSFQNNVQNNDSEKKSSLKKIDGSALDVISSNLDNKHADDFDKTTSLTASQDDETSDEKNTEQHTLSDIQLDDHSFFFEQEEAQEMYASIKRDIEPVDPEPDLEVNHTANKQPVLTEFQSETEKNHDSDLYSQLDNSQEPSLDENREKEKEAQAQLEQTTLEKEETLPEEGNPDSAIADESNHNVATTHPISDNTSDDITVKQPELDVTASEKSESINNSSPDNNVDSQAITESTPSHHTHQDTHPLEEPVQKHISDKPSSDISFNSFIVTNDNVVEQNIPDEDKTNPIASKPTTSKEESKKAAKNLEVSIGEDNNLKKTVLPLEENKTSAIDDADTSNNHQPIFKKPGFIGLIVANSVLFFSLIYKLWFQGLFPSINPTQYKPISNQIESAHSSLSHLIELPKRRNINQLFLLSASNQPHSSGNDSTLFNLQFANTASYTQILPRIQIVLKNKDGEVVARRTLKPTQYLNSTSNHYLIKSNEIKQISLQLKSLPKEVSGYEIKLIEDEQKH